MPYALRHPTDYHSMVTDDEDLQTNLSKYLLKTLCSETFKAAVNSLAAENLLAWGH